MTDAISIEEPGLGDVRMVVDGADVAAASGDWIEVESPRDGRIIARVPRAGDADVDAAVAAAVRAFPAWRDTPARVRGDLLRRVADALEPHVERLGELMSRENGNALRTQTRGEARYAVDGFRYFAGLAQEAKGETIPIRADALDYSRREPFGVVGAIVPWNAPVQLAALKIAPAIAMGNTIVLKAAETAPLAVLELGRICQQVLPPGVVNVICGYGREAGERLTSHPEVAKLSFTGSTAVGKRVMEKAADRIVPVSLELGGKSPQIVFADSDNDTVAQGVIAGMRFFRQGQSCTAGSRLFIHRDVFESFLDKLVAALSKLRVGDPLDEATDMGCISSRVQYEKVCDYIVDGMSQPGARLLAGGVPSRPAPPYLIEPTVLADVDNSWRIAREEVFGPVVCAIPWDDEAEVVAMANQTHYGLAGFVWCNDLTKALRTAHRIDAGWIQVNQGAGQVLGQSYGGFKQSGMGREFSLEGMLDSFTHRKHISVNLPEGS